MTAYWHRSERVALRRVRISGSERVKLGAVEYAPLRQKLSGEVLESLDCYGDLLFEQAMPAGFIGECTRDELTLRHVFDAILPAIAPESSAQFPLWQNAALNIFDLGAGAGLPSLPLAILFPQHHFHLVDAQEKRLAFGRSAAAAVGLSNVSFYHCVVQDFQKKFPNEAKADVVVFRAFRKILASLELALHVLPHTATPLGEEVHRAQPKVLYWRSQPVPFSAEGTKRLSDLGYDSGQFVKFTSAEAVLPRGMYIFTQARAAVKPFPRPWKKISADSLVEAES
jgi:16S rRNA G527 N7-methylase RsmG